MAPISPSCCSRNVTSCTATSQKLVDSSKLTAMGWKQRVGIEQGLRDTYAWYLKNVASAH